jgi:hypothetical protein
VQVRKFVDEAYQRTVTIVEEKKEFLTAMSQCLLEKEVRGERAGGEHPREHHGEHHREHHGKHKYGRVLTQ